MSGTSHGGRWFFSSIFFCPQRSQWIGYVRQQSEKGNLEEITFKVLKIININLCIPIIIIIIIIIIVIITITIIINIIAIIIIVMDAKVVIRKWGQAGGGDSGTAGSKVLLKEKKVPNLYFHSAHWSFLASQDALEVIVSVSQSVSDSKNRVDWCDPGEWRYLLRTLLTRLW